MSPIRPNFLVIVADDLGFSDIGCFGGEIRTPNIDRLGYEGMRFTQFYAAAACSPTRSMLLTGTDNHITGLGQLFETIRTTPAYMGKPGHEGYLNDKVAALPEMLYDGGYQTLMSGKWHLGLLPQHSPSARGFERSFSLLPGCANHYGWEPQLKETDKVPRFFETAVSALHMEDEEYVPKLPEDYYSSDSYATKLIDYLEDHHAGKDNRPFFAYLPFSAPHWPLQAPQENIAHYRGFYDDGPDALRSRRLEQMNALGLIPSDVNPHPVQASSASDWESLTESQKQKSARIMEVYAGMVERMDWNIGRVLKSMEDLGYLDNTVVIFMSDNGAEGASWEAQPLFGDQVESYIEKYYDNSLDNLGNYNSYAWYGTRWAQAATAPSRLYKGFSSEGGIHVPFILSYKGINNQRQGTISTDFATVMDITPTLLEYASIPQPNNTFRGRQVASIRGKSWVSYLGDNDVSQIHDQDATVGWELLGHGALRKGEWKITFIGKPYGPERWQLYNIKQDPGETDDLSEDYPDKLQELLRHWEEYSTETGVVGLMPDIGVVHVDEMSDDTKWMKYESLASSRLMAQVRDGGN